jgi:hypothetical protein
LNVYFPAADTTLIARFSPYAQTGGYSPDGTKVELWARRVTRVDDAITTDNPESLPPGILAGMSAMLVGLGLGVILWFLLVARRRGFRREDEPSSPVGVMGPVAASDVLWR